MGGFKFPEQQHACNAGLVFVALLAQRRAQIFCLSQHTSSEASIPPAGCQQPRPCWVPRGCKLRSHGCCNSGWENQLGHGHPGHGCSLEPAHAHGSAWLWAQAHSHGTEQQVKPSLARSSPWKFSEGTWAADLLQVHVSLCSFVKGWLTWGGKSSP